MNLITNAPQMTNPTLTRRTSLVSARACIAAWLDTLSVLVARGRAQVGVAAAIGLSVSEICGMPIRMIVGRLTSSAGHSVF
eukprot:COSAG02_NODE_274_length_26244_cov_36.943507_12_plen_81_part_00